jgi:L-seryl-tRNA(Ser) seleniumtransferase
VQESLHAGATLVAFSGDKLLGGPQAGILVGEGATIAKLRRHPLARALRPDKLCLAALAATLSHYVKGDVLQTIPVWKMISTEETELRLRAVTWQQAIGRGEIIQGRSTVGGGSLPEETLPTWLLAIRPRKAQALVDSLRQADLPIIARIEADQALFDPRTVLLEQEEVFLHQLRSIIGALEES